MHAMYNVYNPILAISLRDSPGTDISPDLLQKTGIPFKNC